MTLVTSWMDRFGESFAVDCGVLSGPARIWRVSSNTVIGMSMAELCISCTVLKISALV